MIRTSLKASSIASSDSQHYNNDDISFITDWVAEETEETIAMRNEIEANTVTLVSNETGNKRAAPVVVRMFLLS